MLSASAVCWLVRGALGAAKQPLGGLVGETIHFKHAFDDDAEFNASGDLVRPGARALADFICDNLRPLVSDVSEVVQHSYYGWGFHVVFDGVSIYNVLNPAGEEAYFAASVKWHALHALLLRRPKMILDRYLATVVGALESAPQLQDVTVDRA